MKTMRLAPLRMLELDNCSTTYAVWVGQLLLKSGMEKIRDLGGACAEASTFGV